MLFFQFKRILYRLHLSNEGLIHLQALLNSRTAMYDGGMVASAYQLSYARGRHLGIFLCKVHGHLACCHKVTFAASAQHLLCGDVIVIAHSFENIVDGERMIVGLHGSSHHTLRKMHVDVAIIDNRICQKGVYHTLKVSYAAIGGFGYISEYVL